MWIKKGLCPYCGKCLRMNKSNNTLPKHTDGKVVCDGSGQSGKDVIRIFIKNRDY